MSEYIIGNDGDESILDLGEFELRFQERERIVRCRDCKYYQDHNFGSKLDWCRHFHYDVHLDGFCKWGVRK